MGIALIFSVADKGIKVVSFRPFKSGFSISHTTSRLPCHCSTSAASAFSFDFVVIDSLGLFVYAAKFVSFVIRSKISIIQFVETSHQRNDTHPYPFTADGNLGWFLECVTCNF